MARKSWEAGASLASSCGEHLRDRLSQGLPKERVLIRVKVDAIDATRRRDRSGIEVLASKDGADLTVSRRKTGGLRRGTYELRCDWALGGAYGWRNHDQDRWNGHARLHGSLSDASHKRCYTLRCMPGRVRMHGLKVIRAEHQDDEREWRVHLYFLSKSSESVATRQEGVFKHGSTAVQAILQNPDLESSLHQDPFEDAWPALIKR